MSERRAGRFVRFKPGKSPRDVDYVLGFLVRSGYRNIPVYRHLLDERRVRPEEIQTAADLPRLPIVEREELFRDAPIRDRIHAHASIPHSVRAATSGSTGFPLDIYMSRPEAIYRRALLLSAWRRFGPLPLSLRVVDVGSWVRDVSGVEVTRRAAVSIARVSIALPVQEQLDILAKHSPHVISGYPTTLEILAEGLRDFPAALSPRLVASRGELLHETTRRTIERAFGCRVADFYNCEEIGNIAWECPRDPAVLHIQTDACLVEVVDLQGNALPAGDEGQVLVTNLYNCTMPFIRYALHDRGILHPPSQGRCACGSRSPRMAVLSGRDDDYLRLPSNRKVSPRLVATAVTRAFEPLALERGVDRFFWKFQVVQDAIDHLTIRIVPDADRAVAFGDVLAPALRRLDPELRCTVELVDGLSLEPSGKFKKVIQAMPGPTAGRAQP